MEVSLINSIYSEFSAQSQQYGLIFGYTADNENHLVSYLVPQTFQQFANELTEDKKNDILNLAEDLHNAVNGYSLLGFIAKESEQITQQALIMKAQEYYVTLQKRLKMKGSFYLCYCNNTSYQILEKKQGQVFSKVSHKEIQENELITIKSQVPLNIEQVLSEKDAQQKLLIEKITDESQNFIASLPNRNTILINNILVTNQSRNLTELTNMPVVNIQFLECSSTPVQEQFYARPYYFRFTGIISINFKAHRSLSVASLKTIISAAVRKELEARIYQVFGDQFAKKTISDAEDIQLPAKYVNNQFKNIVLSVYVSHSSIQDYGSCIYPSLLDAENIFISEFPGLKVEFQAVDTLKVVIGGNTSSSNIIENKQTREQTRESIEQQLRDKENRKQQISYFLFATVIVVLAYIYLQI